MKTKLFLFFIGIIALLSNCQQKECCVMPPDCLNQIVEEIKAAEVTNPPKKVFQLSFEGKTYYYVTAPCCDFFSELYDENCNLVCAPDGGITGGGDGKCPEGFVFDDAEREIVFEDQR